MTCTPISSPTRRAAAAPASVAAFTDPTSPRISAVTSPASTFCQLTRTTFAVLSIASAASIIPTRPRVSIMPSASPIGSLESVGSGLTFGILPPLAAAQFRDVRDMMTGVPPVHLHLPVERQRIRVFRMHEVPLPVRPADRLVDRDPPRMQAVQELQRNLHRQRRVGKNGKLLLVVRHDRRAVLRQRHLEPRERVDMAVSDVMHHLPHGPPSR